MYDLPSRVLCIHLVSLLTITFIVSVLVTIVDIYCVRSCSEKAYVDNFVSQRYLDLRLPTAAQEPIQSNLIHHDIKFEIETSRQPGEQLFFSQVNSCFSGRWPPSLSKNNKNVIGKHKSRHRHTNWFKLYINCFNHKNTYKKSITYPASDIKPEACTEVIS